MFQALLYKTLPTPQITLK